MVVVGKFVVPKLLLMHLSLSLGETRPFDLPEEKVVYGIG